jgi:hypothetical protein
MMILILGAVLVLQHIPSPVRGVVVNRDGGAPLAGVVVRIDGTAATAITDRRGRFEIADVAPGRHTLRASLIGFGLARRAIQVDAGKPIDISIVLVEGTDPYREEVVVQGELFREKEPSVPAQHTLGSAEIQELGNLSVNDPMRSIQILPGVTTGDDFRSEFAVRGSGFRHMTFTVDGVPTTFLLHTVQQVRDGGSVAMVSGAVLSEITLLSGSYPQRFGNRLGAEVDFRMREGARDGMHGRAAVSGTEASAVAEGPIGSRKSGSWLISVRKSYLDFLLARLTDEYAFGFTFADMQAKAVYEPSPRHRLALSFIAGHSRLDPRDKPGGNRFLHARNASQLAIATWRYSPSSSFVVTQRLALGANQFTNRDTEDIDGRGHAIDLTWRADAVLAMRGLQIEAGSAVQRQSRHVEERSRLEQGDYDGAALWSSAYAQARWSNARASLTGGARIDHWTLTNELTASPWLLGDLGLGRGFVLRAGTSIQRQAPDFDQVLSLRAGANLSVERAYHTDIGIERAIGASGRWRVTLYNRQEHDRLRLWASEPWLFNGRDVAGSYFSDGPWRTTLDGYARGVELLLQRRSASGLSGWLSYSFARNRYRDRITRESFEGDFDQRHTFNAYGAWRLTSRTSVAARLRAGSNTPATGYFEERDGGYYISATKNRVRVPAYARLDVRGSRTFALGSSRLTLFVEIINALGRENVRFITPDVNYRNRMVSGLFEPLLPRLPSAGLTIDF